MTYLPIQLPPGIVRGANPDDAPGRWYDGSLIRWREGVMEPVGGWSPITTTPLAGIPRRLHQWRMNNNTLRTLVGTDERLYADESSKFYNVAPIDLPAYNSTATAGGYGAGAYGTGTYGTPRTGSSSLTPVRGAWSFSNWGEDVLAVASWDGRILYYDASTPTSDAMAVGTYFITSIVRASNVVTVTTSTAHNLSTNDKVAVTDVPISTLNISSATVTVTGATTFTYSQTGADASWAPINSNPLAGAAVALGDDPGFALDFTDDTYAFTYVAKVRDLSVPIGCRSILVTPERHALVLQPGGEPRRVAWSSREDYTDWNFSSTTNTAGFLDLQSETPLLAMAAVREGTLIWSSNRAFLLRYTGQPFIYGADELGTTRIYAPYTYAEFDGRAVWMDSSGFMLYEGGAMRSLPCPLTDYVFSNIDSTFGPRVAHASVNGRFDEVWFFYPSTGQSECDRYVVWNWSENWWSMGKMARTTAFPAGPGSYPIMATVNGTLYQHENGWTYDAFDCANNVFVASGTINLEDTERALPILQLVPSNGGNYALTKYTFFSRMTPNGAERTFGPYYSRSDGYVDTRVVGRDVRLRICANAAGDWSIGRLRLKLGNGGGTR